MDGERVRKRGLEWGIQGETQKVTEGGGRRDTRERGTESREYLYTCIIIIRKSKKIFDIDIKQNPSSRLGK